MADGEDTANALRAFAPRPPVVGFPGMDESSDRNPDMQRVYKGLEQSSGRSEELFKQRESAVGPLRDEAVTMSEWTPAERQKMAGLRDQQQLKPPPKNEFMEDAKSWMAAATIIAGIGAAKSRTSAITGLEAMAGAMTGLREGAIDKAKMSYEEWRAANEAIRENNKAKNDQYKQILENKRLDLDMKVQQIQLVASQFQDQIAFEAAKRADLVTLGKLITAEDIATKKLEMAEMRMNAKIEAQEAKSALAKRPSFAERSTGWWEQFFGKQPGEPFTPQEQKYIQDIMVAGRDPVGVNPNVKGLTPPARGADAAPLVTQPSNYAGGDGTQQRPLAVPSDPKLLKVGMWYKSKDGRVAMWNGTEFIPAQ